MNMPRFLVPVLAGLAVVIFLVFTLLTPSGDKKSAAVEEQINNTTSKPEAAAKAEAEAAELAAKAEAEAAETAAKAKAAEIAAKAEAEAAELAAKAEAEAAELASKAEAEAAELASKAKAEAAEIAAKAEAAKAKAAADAAKTASAATITAAAVSTSESASDSSIPQYGVQAGMVDKGTFNGYRRFHGTCHACHGQDAAGGSFAPSLVESLKTVDYATFRKVVSEGQMSTGASGAVNAMPAFSNDPNIMKHLDDIYRYLAARSDGVVGPGRPKKIPK